MEMEVLGGAAALDAFDHVHGSEGSFAVYFEDRQALERSPTFLQ